MALSSLAPFRTRRLSRFGFNNLSVGFAGARRRASAWLPRRLFGRRVGGHLYGPFCRIPCPSTWRTHRDSIGPEIGSGHLAANMCRSLNGPQRPSQPPQRDDLLFLFFAQDIAHLTEPNVVAPEDSFDAETLRRRGSTFVLCGLHWLEPMESELPDQLEVQPCQMRFDPVRRAAFGYSANPRPKHSAEGIAIGSSSENP
jgi:hypothetical protein